ncbi:unnamed protein product, partial [Staurois parvus]
FAYLLIKRNQICLTTSVFYESILLRKIIFFFSKNSPMWSFVKSPAGAD